MNKPYVKKNKRMHREHSNNKILSNAVSNLSNKLEDMLIKEYKLLQLEDIENKILLKQLELSNIEKFISKYNQYDYAISILNERGEVPINNNELMALKKTAQLAEIQQSLNKLTLK